MQHIFGLYLEISSTCISSFTIDISKRYVKSNKQVVQLVVIQFSFRSNILDVYIRYLFCKMCKRKKSFSKLKSALDNLSLIPIFFQKQLRFLHHKKCIPIIVAACNILLRYVHFSFSRHFRSRLLTIGCHCLDC